MDSNSNTPRAKRRWFQYSLRTLFLATAIFALWLGIKVHRARQERRGIAAIRDAGGSVRYDYQYSDDGKFHADAKPPEPKVLRDMIGDEYFARVVEAKLNTLEFGDADLKQLEGLRELKALRIFETDVTDEGLGSLKRLTKLEVLDLANLEVTDVVLAVLATLEDLKRLRLDGTKITDDGLVHLKGLRQLETLSISYTTVGDEGLAHLEDLRALTEIQLSGTRITDSGLVHLRGLQQLRDLLLSNTRVTDAGLVHLHELPNLEFVGLAGTQVRDQGVNRLKEVRPNCRIVK